MSARLVGASRSCGKHPHTYLTYSCNVIYKLDHANPVSEYFIVMKEGSLTDLVIGEFLMHISVCVTLYTLLLQFQSKMCFQVRIDVANRPRIWSQWCQNQQNLNNHLRMT